jgi:hypothetical protein
MNISSSQSKLNNSLRRYPGYDVLLFMIAVAIGGFISGAIAQLPEGRLVPRPDESKEKSAQGILEKVEKTYSTCKSYRDTGTIKIVSVKSGRASPEKSFNTAFIRPDRLRFEIGWVPNRLNFPNDIVWRKGEQFRFTPAGRAILAQAGVEKPDMKIALAAIAGASAFAWRSSGTHGLLFPKEIDEYPRITELKDAKRIDDEKIGKRECFRIQGTGTIFDQPVMLWIDKESFLIRRIKLTTKLEKSWTESTTDYDPEIDAKISDEALEFEKKEK